MTPAHSSQLGVLDLISQSGWVAKFVLLILVTGSIFCWAIIVTKWRKMKVVHSQNEKFMNVFWNGKNLDEIVTKSEKYPESPVAAVFKYAVKELRKFSVVEETAPIAAQRIDNIYRALIRASTTEISTLEKNVNWLATMASAAPFVGLFGTVWGIMNSFQNIGATGAANLAVVAPGISEALITTATGIGAAIPAVIAYNYFVGQIKKVAVDMECFSQDFINIVQRSYLNGKKGN
jgi:biopolymer transport protein TolQ